VFSLNVPVPGAVRRLASDLHPALVGFESVRAEPTLVAKRLGAPGPGEYDAVQKRVRRALVGAPAFEARIDGVGVFREPPSGPSPVVYLAVESPGLAALHDRLVEAFEPVPDLEGESYVPHVTLARGGDADAAERLAGREVEPVTWTVTELEFYDARHGEPAGTIPLPA
jgi:2'-5' RNA ligase